MRLDLNQLTSRSCEGAKPLAEYLVHMAQAEALLMMGQDEQVEAYGLAEQHV